MKDWKKFLAQKINTEEYYIAVPTKYDMFQFRIRYVKHNGYTLVLPVDHAAGELSIFGVKFIEWFKFRADFNTRYERKGHWTPIRFNRKKKLVIWAVRNINAAYEQFKREMVDKTINE
jgi:hypothetical protein